MIAKLIKVVATLLVLGVIGYFALPRLVCTDVPKRQKLADCNTNALAFTMTCDHSPPYQFVLGLGPSHTGRSPSVERLSSSKAQERLLRFRLVPTTSPPAVGCRVLMATSLHGTGRMLERGWVSCYAAASVTMYVLRFLRRRPLAVHCGFLRWGEPIYGDVAEPQHSADGDQPFRSVTIRASVAAGPRR